MAGENWLIATPSWSDAATVTASHELPDCPASNLQTYQPSDVWATDEVYEIPYIDVDLTSVMRLGDRWNLIALLHTNARRGDLFRVVAGDSAESLGTPAYDSGRSLRLATHEYAFQQNDAIGAVTNFTMEARIRLRLMAGGAIFHKVSANTLAVDFSFEAPPSLVVMDGNVPIITHPVNFSLMDWVHVGVTRIGSEVWLYVDGKRVAVATTSTVFSGDQFGCGWLSTRAEAARIDVDWLRLWGVPRTHEQVEAYAHEQIASDPNLVCCYNFEGTLANGGTIGGNATHSGTPTYVFTEALWASPDLDRVRYPHALLWVPGGRAEQYVRIYLDCQSNPDELASAGRVMVANALQFRWNPSRGAETRAYEDRSIHRWQHGGQRVITRATPVPRMRLPYMFDDEAEMNKMMDIVGEVGSGGDVLVVLNPSKTNRSRHQGMVHGTLQSRVGASASDYDVFRSEFDVLGLIP